jgi:subtilisin family serine protease
MGNKAIRSSALASAVAIALMGVGVTVPSQAASSNPLTIEASRTYIIKFVEPGMLHYAGGVNGLAATSPQAVGSRKLDIHTAAATAYAAYLKDKRAEHIASIEQTLGRSLAISHSYAILSNGIAAKMTATEANRLVGAPGIESVDLEKIQHTTTYRGPTFIGANTIWDGSNTPNGTGTRGEGIIAGDLDTGTNSTHPSFANDPACGFSVANPKLVAVDCSSSAGGLCNGPDPEAAQGNGHGVHTASTIAGNTIDNTAVPPPALPDGVTMSGVAPCAALRSYKVCQTNQCGSADIAAGIENAIADQVDVLNFSISGGTSPWNDNDRAFLDAINADVFVAAAAGNLQPGETDPVGKVNHKGPWLLSVAASSQDEMIGPNLSLTGPGTPPADGVGVPLNPGSTTPANSTPTYSDHPVKTYPPNVAGCTDGGGIPAGTFTGSIAVLRRGATNPDGGTACSFTEKIANAFNAGADMVVIGNNVAGAINMDTTGAPNVPAYSVSMASGNALIDFATTNPTNATADVVPIGLGNIQGDVLADFSYRGPTPAPLEDLNKPDISAPGVNIYAALTTSEGSYGFLSGTSMATPHITGSGALIRSVHPDWTVEEVNSVLETTATNADGVEEDGTTPWTIDDVGSGRVDLTKAALAGLTIDETYANFLAANPNGGTIDVKELNIPSLRDMDCTSGCSWTRTVTNRLSAQGSWNVSFQGISGGFGVTTSPSSFTLAPGATQTLTFTADEPAAQGVISYGNVVLTETNGQSPDQHIRVAVKAGVPAAEIDVTPTSLTASQDADQSTSQTLTIDNTGGAALTFDIDTNGSVAVPIASQGTDTGGNGIVSDYFTPLSGGVYAADDFQVTAASQVAQLFADGFVQTSDLTTEASSIDFYIYADAGGQPAGQPEDGANNYVWTFTAAPGDPGVDVTDDHVQLDLAAAGAPALDLSPGTYWIIVTPHVNNTGDEDTRWNWFASDGTNNFGTGALLVDPNDFFGAGATDWTDIVALTGSGVFAGLSFSVSGEASCGASWLSVSPASGSVPAGGSTGLNVTFDSTGLSGGTYTTNVCVTSNDADESLVTVPVTLTVNGDSADIVFHDGFDGP